MLHVNPPQACDKLTRDFSREMEDQLDWQENQQRAATDVRRVDAAFVGGSVAATLLWTLMWTGATVGGAVAVAMGMSAGR